jgi:hypothetical protein
MPFILKAGKRLTHKYKANYAHLDQWDESNPAIIKVLKGKRLTEWERQQRQREDPRKSYIDASDAGMSYFNVVVKSPKGLTANEVYRALVDNMNYGGCSHDFDCCGCGSGYVSTVRRTGRNEWYVEMEHTRNY